jgi:hypothetical protein
MYVYVCEPPTHTHTERVRVLTRVSMAKDAVLTLSEENTSQLEVEMDDLREVNHSHTYTHIHIYICIYAYV